MFFVLQFSNQACYYSGMSEVDGKWQMNTTSELGKAVIFHGWHENGVLKSKPELPANCPDYWKTRSVSMTLI